jgi:hypothetical protein
MGLGSLMAMGLAAALAAEPISAEHRCHALNAYWESVAAKEPEDASRLVLYVARMRAQDGDPYWGNTTCSVVYAKAVRTVSLKVRVKKHIRKVKRTLTQCDFSWTCLSVARRQPTNLFWWADAVRLAKDDLEGKYTPPPEFALARFYLNRRASSRGGRGWQDRNTVALGYVHPESRHEFRRWKVHDEDGTRLASR